MQRILRASTLDDLFACTPSTINEDGQTQIDNGDEDASSIGKAIHAMAASYVEAGKFDMAGECERRDIPLTDDIGYLMSQACRTWDSLKGYFPSPRTERRVTSKTVLNDEYVVAATVDVVSPASGGAIFVDWKSGYKTGYKHQLFGTAYALWDHLGRPEDGIIVGIIAHLRQGYYRTKKYPAASLKEWEYDLSHNVLRSRVYRPGEHCVTCTRFHTCDARRELVSGSVGSLLLPNNVPATDEHKLTIQRAINILSSLTDLNKDSPEVAEAVHELIGRVGMVEKVCKDVRALLKDAVVRVGGIPLDADSILILRQIDRCEIEPAIGLKVLRQRLTDKEIIEGVMSLSLPRAQALLAAKQGRGAKGKAKELLKKELDEAGALTKWTEDRLSIVDKEKVDVQTLAGDLRTGRGIQGPATGADAGAGERVGGALGDGNGRLLPDADPHRQLPERG
jgi:hypothetical protein